MNELPEDMLGNLRERLGVDDDDDSKDAVIAAMTPEQQVRELVAWETGDDGLAGYVADVIIATGADVRKLSSMPWVAEVLAEEDMHREAQL